MDGSGIKREAQRLVEQLPEQASWDDLMYEIYVRQAIHEHDIVVLTAARPELGLQPGDVVGQLRAAVATDIPTVRTV